MEQRQEFIRGYLQRNRSLAALCRSFGISRKTAYKWLSRFMEGGLPALVDRSRARESMAHKTPPWTEELIVAFRKKHPTWGPKKIVAVLQGMHPAITFPAPSTAGQILKVRGLVKDRRHKSNKYTPLGSFEPRPIAGPNSTWCADFKGQFRLGNGVLCYPATLTDAFSRKVLRCEALTTTAREPTQAVWESAFREFGLPAAIRTDNGVPFRAPNSMLQLSALAVYLIELGIDPEFIEPGNPQQNGSHERMHRTLKAETVEPPAPNLKQQQERFDEFMQEFNEERPHEALSMKVPNSVYSQSSRSFPSKNPSPEYGEHLHTRRVNHAHGVFIWNGKQFVLSKALGGKTVGIEYICDGLARVQFFSKVLAMIDEEEELLIPNLDWHAPGNDA
jgi:transposase InsO family protein